jgi:hypothetical protein
MFAGDDSSLPPIPIRSNANSVFLLRSMESTGHTANLPGQKGTRKQSFMQKLKGAAGRGTRMDSTHWLCSNCGMECNLTRMHATWVTTEKYAEPLQNKGMATTRKLAAIHVQNERRSEQCIVGAFEKHDRDYPMLACPSPDLSKSSLVRTGARSNAPPPHALIPPACRQKMCRIEAEGR